MDRQDAAYELTDGESPDHIILSESMWNFLDESHNFEQLKDTSGAKKEGFIGMKVWKCSSLEKHGKHALLLSESAFRHVAPLAKDYPFE
jgi:hypothetical protein